MNIAKITCSDPREHNDPRQILDLMEFSPLVEVAVQAHDTKMNRGLPRHEWFSELLSIIKERDAAGGARPLNLAVHVNAAWCTDFCNGEVVRELDDWLNSRNENTGEYTIKRWQLNIGGSIGRISSVKMLATLKRFPGREFIFQYSAKTMAFVHDLYVNGGNAFSLLFDNSGGEGEVPKAWAPPVFDDVLHGYSGGLGPDNVVENLNKIVNLVPKDRNIWIDAEYKLKDHDTKQFDVCRARDYVSAALNWQKERGGR